MEVSHDAPPLPSRLWSIHNTLGRAMAVGRDPEVVSRETPALPEEGLLSEKVLNYAVRGAV